MPKMLVDIRERPSNNQSGPLSTLLSCMRLDVSESNHAHDQEWSSALDENNQHRTGGIQFQQKPIQGSCWWWGVKRSMLYMKPTTSNPTASSQVCQEIGKPS